MHHGLVSIALALFLLAVPAAAQPRQEPGQGQLIRIGQVVVAEADGTAVVADLVREGRVRGLRLIARGGTVEIARVIVRYANGQVHYEDRDIVLLDGEQTRLIDPRFEERKIESVEIVLKPGRRPQAVTLELHAPQSPEEIADVRRQRQRAAKRRFEAPAEPTVETAPKAGPVGKTRDAGAVEPYTGVAVFYGTDRKREADRVMADQRKLLAFGIQPDKLALGKAIVTVPKARRPGEIPRPEVSIIVRQIAWGEEDRARHFTLLTVDPLLAGPFGTAISQHLAAASRFPRQAFVFVHGFNVSFDDALFRAAQISHDMGFDGLPLVYSWPSAGRAEAYELDRSRASASSENLVEFLNLVAASSGAETIHLISHSTGAFVLIEALKQISRAGATAAATSSRLGQIVFAAPDVLQDQFKTDAERVNGLGRGTTLYASSGDWALWLSGILRTGVIPAGTIPRNGIPVIAAGVDSIDVSRLDTSYFALNHSGFGDHETLVRDMGALIQSGTRPPNRRDNRFLERNEPQTGASYWRYEAR